MSAKNKAGIDPLFLEQQLLDAEIPGHYGTFTDEEAASLGAFEEDALSEADAFAASFHNPELVAEVEAELPQ
jgi:hypothetical protein